MIKWPHKNTTHVFYAKQLRSSFRVWTSPQSDDWTGKRSEETTYGVQVEQRSKSHFDGFAVFC